MDANDYFQRGIQQQNAGDYASAISDLEKAAELAPESFEVWWALGKTSLLMGNRIEQRHAYRKANFFKMKAADAYEKAASLNPVEPRAGKALEIAQTLRTASQERRKLGML